MKVRYIIASGLIVLLIALIWSRTDKAASTTQPKSTTDPAGKVAASVNGEPIYESEVMAGMPDDAFQDQLDDMKKGKLKRLIEETVQVQFLKAHKITVSDDEMAKGLKDFEAMVKTPGCPCCGGGYENLDQFMKINCFPMAEVRRRVSCDIGMKLYIERLTKEQTSPEALADALKKNRAKIELDRVEGYLISFEYSRDPEYYKDEKGVQAKKGKLADDALARLKKGDSFEKVAKEMSEDETSAPKSGALGCIRADFLGPEAEQAFRKLEPGAYSGVLKAPWGRCIVMRKKLTEEEIMSVVKEQAKSSAEDQAYQEFKTMRERTKIQEGSLTASASAPL